MASAVVDAIARDGHELTVSKRSHSHATRLAAAYENVTIADNQAVIDRSDVLILGLLAGTAKDLLPRLELREDQKIISLMAGVSHQELSALTHPATRATIAIPFPFIAKGGSPILTYPQSDLVEELFGVSSILISLNTEEDLNAFMAVQAVRSPVLKLLQERAGWLSGRGVDRGLGEHFLASLIGGSLHARADQAGEVFGEMLEELNTEGGLNAELREYMVAAGMNETLLEGLALLEARLKGP